MRALVILVLLTRTAFAWDGIGMWYRAADDANPGGGGITATGGARDHGITCKDCHTERVDNPNLKLEFSFAPLLPTQTTYAPGQRYTVTVDLRNTTLASNCSVANVDNFAATFEDASGKPAGLLMSDSGQSAASCPLAAPDPATTNTTALYGDCATILATGKPNIDRWTFTWTAPTSGTVRIFYGGVDGNCDMMSMRDAVVVGTRTLTAP